MTHSEYALLAAFLYELGDRYDCDGCNDFRLPATEEYLALVAGAERDIVGKPDDDAPRVRDGQIMTNNSIVLGHLLKKFRAQHGIVEMPDIGG